ncbi:MAG TPA: extracellular solute-binding protein [Candidatus Limnocylindria bacterium]|nr:extracellular solute-binding protein [Candidatus Limnocylindria bacterium]
MRVPFQLPPRAVVVFAALALAASCTFGPAATPTPADPASMTGSLTVLDWSGYEEEPYWADFKAKYPNVDVGFEFGVSDADIYGKMKAGSQADVFHPYTGWLQFYVDEGMVEEIDTSRLANWDKVPESFRAVGRLNGKQYFVPFDWGFTSILYRTDMVEGEIDSWSALFDETYAGKISMWDDGPGAVTVSTYIHGWDETAVTDEQLAQAKAEWIAQAPLNRAYWASEYADLVPMMQSGEVAVAYSWQGAYATLLGEGVPVAYADPVEGRNSWVGVYGIRKGTPNYDLALRFLDEKLGTLTGENLVNNFYYGHANGEVMAGITDETLKEAFSIDDPDILERTNFTPNLTAAQRDAWTQMWAEVKASQ